MEIKNFTVRKRDGSKDSSSTTVMVASYLVDKLVISSAKIRKFIFTTK